ncbi:MAG: hypothetical protein USCGTAYLOR_02620 [Chromatiales bacterium USCg_Taylor]|nr:MAG: hypothetical protein USCGTAYLOR_02620 [Chromatiales bacterium USCg_Taylor]
MVWAGRPGGGDCEYCTCPSSSTHLYISARRPGEAKATPSVTHNSVPREVQERVSIARPSNIVML